MPTCKLDVPPGVALTVASGAVMKFAAKGTLTVEGTLGAVGTASDPIIFTSVDDNTGLVGRYRHD